MSVPGGDWRHEPAYDFIDALAPEQVPFEFLRRNPDYLAEYLTISAHPLLRSPPPALARWGLRFCGRSEPLSSSSPPNLVASGQPAPRRADFIAAGAVRWPRDGDGAGQPAAGRAGGDLL